MLPTVPASAAGASFGCGPVVVRLEAPRELLAAIARTLALYDVRWSERVSIDVAARERNGPVPVAVGRYLRCLRMNVDRERDGLVATTANGAHLRSFDDDARWELTVPSALLAAGRLEEVEDLLSLVVTTGWRRCGWVPLHAAAVVRGTTCAVACAPSGGGKSSFSAALVRAGWRTLGDDKLLLRRTGDGPELAALLHTFNLHPHTARWFPEADQLEQLPRYSALTEKRKVRSASLWPAAPAERARPTVLVALDRSSEHHAVRVRPLAPPAVRDLLLRQTVVPRDASVAGPIVATIADAAAQMRGIALEIGDDAYADPGASEAIANAIEAA